MTSSSQPWTLTARWILPIDGPPLEHGTITIDGKTDLAVDIGNGGASIAGIPVLLGDGAGHLGVPVYVYGLIESNGITAADVNGDGRPDLLSGQQTGGGVLNVALNTTPT